MLIPFLLKLQIVVPGPDRCLTVRTSHGLTDVCDGDRAERAQRSIPKPSTGSSLTNGLVALNKSAILSAVSGRWLVPEPSAKQAAFDFSEAFGADGIWPSSRAERALRVLEGIWTVKDDRLCVQITRAPWGNLAVGEIRCRVVWRNPANRNVVMSDMGSVGGASIVEFSAELNSQTAR